MTVKVFIDLNYHGPRSGASGQSVALFIACDLRAHPPCKNKKRKTPGRVYGLGLGVKDFLFYRVFADTNYFLCRNTNQIIWGLHLSRS